MAATAAARQKHWRKFVMADDEREAALRRGEWAIGDEAFRQRTAMQQCRPVPRGRGRPRKQAELRIMS